MRRLVAGCAATAAVYIPLALYADASVSPSTPSVVLVAGITFAALAATMVRSTQGWSLRAVGLFLMLTGAAVLLIAGFVNYRWPMDARTAEAWSDLVLACWIVGSPLALIGVAAYAMGGDIPPDEDGE